MTILDRAEFNRRCRDHKEDPTDALWEESWKGLIEYEKLLKWRNNGKNIRAMRTWNSLKDHGLIKSTAARVLGKGDAFCVLMRAGQGHLTDEHLVLKHRHHFVNYGAAIAKAQAKFDEWERENPASER